MRTLSITLLIAASLAVTRTDAQILLRSYTAEDRYNHVRLPADGAALTVWSAPVTMRIEEVDVRFVNECDSTCEAEIVIVVSDGAWRPLQPRTDVHPPVPVRIGPRADTVVHAVLPGRPLLLAGETFLAGAVVRSAALTVRMDRVVPAHPGMTSQTTSTSMFALPRANGSWRIGASYADGRHIGNWYIDVIATASQRASQVARLESPATPMTRMGPPAPVSASTAAADAPKTSALISRVPATSASLPANAASRTDAASRTGAMSGTDATDGTSARGGAGDARGRAQRESGTDAHPRSTTAAGAGNVNLRPDAAERARTEVSGPSPMNGTPANGPSPNGTSANGTSANGTSANGTSANGTPANGTPANGTPANGTSSTVAPAAGRRGLAALMLHVPAPALVEVAIEDGQGRLVRMVRKDTLAAGVHFVSWDGRCDDNHTAGPGAYTMIVRVEGRESVRKTITRR